MPSLFSSRKKPFAKSRSFLKKVTSGVLDIKIPTSSNRKSQPSVIRPDPTTVASTVATTTTTTTAMLSAPQPSSSPRMRARELEELTRQLSVLPCGHDAQKVTATTPIDAQPPYSLAAPKSSTGVEGAVDRLPVELLIQIFSLLVEPTDALGTWRDDLVLSRREWDPTDVPWVGFNDEQWDKAERQRKSLRLTCRKWNTILVALAHEFRFDLGWKKNHSLADLSTYPPNLRKYSITNSCYSCSNPVVNTGIDAWLTSGNLSKLERFTVQGCPDLSIEGLKRIPNTIKELKLIDCPRITQTVLVSAFEHLRNLTYLLVHTDQFFSDSDFSVAIQTLLPNLRTLHLFIRCADNALTGVEGDDDDLGAMVITQSVPSHGFPDQVTELILSQDLPQHKHYVLKESDQKRLGSVDDLPFSTVHQLALDSPDAYPTSLTRLNILQCSFENDVFVLPRNLTHLTVGFPNIPQDHETIALPSTLEYLHISGFIYHNAYLNETDHPCLEYGERWMKMLPEEAPALHTLIVHVHLYNPASLYTLIGSRYASSLRHLDCCVCYSLGANYETSCGCLPEECFMAQCHRRDMIRSLPHLRELKLHNPVNDEDLVSLPDSVKDMWLYPGYTDDVSLAALGTLNERGVHVKCVPEDLFGCSSAATDNGCQCTLFKLGQDATTAMLAGIHEDT